MTLVTAANTTVPTRARVKGGAVRRFIRNPLGLIPAIVLFTIVVLSIITPLFPLPDPNLIDLRGALQGPSSEHLLGTDGSGRDILSRLLWGSRINLLGAALAVVVALAVGVPSGLLAGYYGGWFDSVSSWVNNLNMALPGIIILLAVRAVVGPSVWVSMGIFGVLLAPALYRLVRAAVQAVRNELYVDAARVSGLGDGRIVSRHILTVVRAPIIIQTARLAAIAIGIQAGLEFLGVSDNSVPSWGSMLNEGFRKIALAPSLILWPSIVIAIVCIALALLGNALRDALEDRGLVTVVRPAQVAAERAKSTPVTHDASTDGALLRVGGLRVSYGLGENLKDVVHDVALHVREGEVLGIVGESGSGKTQTAFAILGLLPDGGWVSGGSIEFDGRELTTLGASDRAALRGTDIAYIPQEPMSNLDPAFRIGYQLTMPIRKKLGLGKAEAKERALGLLSRVGIPDPEKTFNSYPHEISGGMAQRVLIAGAVSCEPRLLIADEPTTALDVTVQAEVLDLLRDLQQERGMAVIMVTHNFGVVADICDRVAVMNAGRIVEVAGTEQIFSAPQDPYTQTLLGSMLEDAPVRPYPFEDDAVGTQKEDK